MIHPLDVKVSAHYGELSDFRKARGMQPHSGTDYPAKRGTPFKAVAKGTIQLVQYSKVLGWVTVQSVWHDNKTYYVGYCHQDSKPDLEVGQKITEGQIIGKVGNTGVSSGAHLHMTFGRSLKAVFGTTAQKVDGYKIIQANLTKPKTQSKTITCPNCGEKYYAKPKADQ